MDEKELRAAYPEIVAQIEANARTEAQNTSSEAVAAERQRIEQIDSIAASIPDQQLVHDAKYGDKPCTGALLPCYAGQRSVRPEFPRSISGRGSKIRSRRRRRST